MTDKEQSLLLLEGGAPLLTVESVVDAERMKAERLLKNPSLLLERVKMKKADSAAAEAAGLADSLVVVHNVVAVSGVSLLEQETKSCCEQRRGGGRCLAAGRD